MPMTKKVDWQALELGYRTGRSFRVLAREFGISSTRIKQIAYGEQWARDLAGAVQPRASGRLRSQFALRSLEHRLLQSRDSGRCSPALYVQGAVALL